MYTSTLSRPTNDWSGHLKCPPGGDFTVPGHMCMLSWRHICMLACGSHELFTYQATQMHF